MESQRCQFIALCGLAELAADVILQQIYQTAQESITPYKDDETGPPHPAFALRLNNEIYTASNFYAIQKFFDGDFQFDIFYESEGQKLDGA